MINTSLKIYFKEALRQLTISKLRAFLAVLGILIGTASVVTMISIGKLATNQILSQFEQLGINLLAVTIYPMGEDSSSSNPHDNLSLKDAKNIVQASPNILLAAPYINSYGNVVVQGVSLSQGSAVGVTPDMITIAKLQLQSGRMLSFLDHQTYFCVIGHHLYQLLQQQGISHPVGQQIAIGNTIFTIVGVLQDWPTNFFFNTDFNNAVLVPLETLLATQKSQISNIALSIADTKTLDATETAIKTYVNAHTQNQQVMIRSPKSLIDGMQKSSAVMTMLLGFIGGISLLVGGIGVMNIMLVSVAERHREIGIRLAVGAKERDIQWQFLIESVTLSIFGGLSGVLIGVIITFFIALYLKWKFVLFMMPILLGFFVSTLVGIFFGFYPARKAAKLDPIVVLRSE